MTPGEIPEKFRRTFGAFLGDWWSRFWGPPRGLGERILGTPGDYWRGLFGHYRVPLETLMDPWADTGDTGGGVGGVVEGTFCHHGAPCATMGSLCGAA